MSALTLAALREELNGLRLHDLTETNVEEVRRVGNSIEAVGDNGGILAELDELRENEKSLAAELKEAEAERDALSRQLDEAEEKLETSPADGPGLLREALENVARFRQAASDWAQEVQRMRAELQAIRKRKGVAAGVCAYSHEIRTLLGYISQCPDNRYYRDASELHRKIMETAQ